MYLRILFFIAGVMAGSGPMADIGKRPENSCLGVAAISPEFADVPQPFHAVTNHYCAEPVNDEGKQCLSVSVIGRPLALESLMASIEQRQQDFHSFTQHIKSILNNMLQGY